MIPSLTLLVLRVSLGTVDCTIENKIFPFYDSHEYSKFNEFPKNHFEPNTFLDHKQMFSAQRPLDWNSQFQPAASSMTSNLPISLPVNYRSMAKQLPDSLESKKRTRRASPDNIENSNSKISQSNFYPRAVNSIYKNAQNLQTIKGPSGNNMTKRLIENINDNEVKKKLAGEMIKSSGSSRDPRLDDRYENGQFAKPAIKRSNDFSKSNKVPKVFFDKISNSESTMQRKKSHSIPINSLNEKRQHRRSVIASSSDKIMESSIKNGPDKSMKEIDEKIKMDKEIGKSSSKLSGKFTKLNPENAGGLPGINFNAKKKSSSHLKREILVKDNFENATFHPDLILFDPADRMYQIPEMKIESDDKNIIDMDTAEDYSKENRQPVKPLKVNSEELPRAMNHSKLIPHRLTKNRQNVNLETRKLFIRKD